MSVKKYTKAFGGVSSNHDGDRYRTGENAIATYEGGVGYKLDDYEELINLVMLGFIEGRFYESQDKILDDTKEIWSKAIQKAAQDSNYAEFIMKLVSYGREVGGMMFQPTLGLVYLSTLPDKRYFHAAFNHVIKTPKDLFDFVHLCRHGNIRKGMGRTVKRAIGNWLLDARSYHFRRYRTKMRDVIKLARPKPLRNQNCFTYAVNGDLTTEEFKALNTVMKKLHENVVDDEVLSLIEKYRFQIEEMKSQFGNLSDENLRKMYKKLIPGLSIQALMINLETICWVFSSNKSARLEYRERNRKWDYWTYDGQVNEKYRPNCEYLSADIIKTVADKLSDVEAYKRSRMLPFTPLQAAKMTCVPEWRQAMLNMVSECIKNMFDSEKLAGKKVRINVDTSGSMRGTRITNRNYDGPGLTTNELAGIFGAAIMQGVRDQKDASIWAIASGYKRVPVRTLDAHALGERIMKTDVAHGTNFEQCVAGGNYAGEDIYILITDGQATDNLEAAWARTKKTPGAKLIIWQVVGYGNKVSDRKDIYTLWGFSDRTAEAIVKIIESGTDQVDIIKNYPVAVDDLKM